MMATSDDENNNKCPLIKILSNHSLLWFQRMQQEGRLCDATLKTDDGASFPVHRIIMGSCSPYFKALFTTTLHPVERKEFTIPGISGNALGTIIRFAYGGQVDITNDNAMDLIVDADQFAVMRLVEECCRFIMSNINCDNCVTIRAFAANYLFKELEDAAHRYLMRNFPEVVNHSRELLQLPMEELCSVLSSDELNIRNEHVLWELLLRWIENDPEKKKPHVCKVMQHIRWGLVESQYFVEKVKIHPLLQDKEECRSLVINILKSMYDLGTLNNQETGFPTPTFARPRMPHDILFAIGGWSGGNATSVMESYDTRADRWIQVQFGYLVQIGPKTIDRIVCSIMTELLSMSEDQILERNHCQSFRPVRH